LRSGASGSCRHRRDLSAEGQPVKLGGRAFDVLMALTEARGAIVGEDALMARVWPDRVVEENSLQSQISATLGCTARFYFSSLACRAGRMSWRIDIGA
jgi:Transcriptional regulatory protein, C terminal